MLNIIDWTKIYKRYKGLWVALLSDEKTVVGSGKSLDLARELAEKKGIKDPIMFFVPKKIMPYIG